MGCWGLLGRLLATASANTSPGAGGILGAVPHSQHPGCLPGDPHTPLQLQGLGESARRSQKHLLSGQASSSSSQSWQALAGEEGTGLLGNPGTFSLAFQSASQFIYLFILTLLSKAAEMHEKETSSGVQGGS